MLERTPRSVGLGHRVPLSVRLGGHTAAPRPPVPQRAPDRPNPRQHRLTAGRRPHPRSLGGRRGLRAAARGMGTHGTSRGSAAGRSVPCAPREGLGAAGQRRAPRHRWITTATAGGPRSFPATAEMRRRRPGAAGRCRYSRFAFGSSCKVVCRESFPMQPRKAVPPRDLGFFLFLQESHGVRRGEDVGARRL